MPDYNEEVFQTKKFLKYRLQNDKTTLRGFVNERKNILDLLARTAEGESNSALLLGPRGCGKSTLLVSVLHELLPQENFHRNTITVYLNGLIHTDDRLALKSATAQLKLENAVDGKVFGSFAENLAFLLACLKAGDIKQSKSVIFILDEFDFFCSHYNQTLLYNLFDVAQSAQSPICVLGITCRLDVVELLEKRVKSRFSHRQIFLLPKDDFADRLLHFKELLSLPTQEKINAYNAKAKIPEDVFQNKELIFLKRTCDLSIFKFHKKYVSSWNKNIENLVHHDRVRGALQNIYDFDVSISLLKSFLLQLISSGLDEKRVFFDVEMIYSLSQQYDIDDKIQLLCGLSVLEICLIISMKHHCQIYDRDPFNYEMILSRYRKFANSSSTMQNIEKGVVLKAFEHIKNLELIAPISTSKAQKEFQLHKLLLTYGQINQAIQKCSNLPTEVCQWSQSSII